MKPFTVTAWAGNSGKKTVVLGPISGGSITGFGSRPWARWTAEQDASLFRLRAEGKLAKQIAHELGRTQKSVEGRVYELRKRGFRVPCVRS